MELNQLRNFVKIAETGQLTRAAKELNIAQPNMSNSIRLLEKELGLPLFDRSGRSLVLNENGKLFYASVSRSLQYLDDGILQIRKRTEAQSKEVALTILAGTRMLPYLLAQVHKQVPQAHIRFLKQELDAQPRAWDIALYATITEPDNDNCFALLRQPFSLVVPEKDPLSERASISLAEVGDAPVITWPQSTLMGKIIRHYFEEAGVSPNVVLETDDGTLTIQLVRAGIGCALAPSVHTAPEGVRYIPIDSPTCIRYIVVECRSDRPVVRKVFDCITAVPYHDFVRVLE